MTATTTEFSVSDFNRTAFPWVVGCGGTEIPMVRSGIKHLYVWNTATKKHGYYLFGADMFVDDNWFELKGY